MEIVDYYDKDRQITGKTGQRHEYSGPDLYRLVVHVCIFNGKNELLIQKRAKEKSFGGMWDLTCAGGVKIGETSTIAAQRELREELGLKINFDKLRPSLTANFSQGFDDFFIIRDDNITKAQIKFQDEEVSDVAVANCEKVIELLKNGEFFPYKENFIRLLFDLSLDDRVIED